MPNPLYLGIMDKTKKREAVTKTNRTETSSTKKQTASAAEPKMTASYRDDAAPPMTAYSKAGSNAEKYKDAGRLGGNGLTKKKTDAAVLAAESTAVHSQSSADKGGSIAEILKEWRFQTKYGKALEKSKESLAKKAAATAKPTYTGTSPMQGTKKPTDAVAAHGSMADYVLVKQAADRVDFTDWDKKTTTQQRTALKRSGLSEEAQWTLLNKDGSYLETLSVISDLRDNRMDYGLSAAETEQIGGELLTIAAARANATGNEQPYLSTIPRGQMVKYLDEKKTALLQSIGYLESDTVGGNTPLWYDGEEDGPMPTPNPKSDRKPQKTPLPQPGPSPELYSTKRSESLAKQMMKVWNTTISQAERLALDTVLKTSLGKSKHVGDMIASSSDLATVFAGQENWLDYVRSGEEETATWDDSMITDQSLYSKAVGSFGAFGNYDDNGCGPIAIHNANRLLGEDSTFADVAYELDSNSRNTAAFGGVLGMNPLVVREYFGSKGYDVTLYHGTEGVKEDHDAYLAMYIYKNSDGSLGGHYVAMKRDPEEKEYITYNEVYSTGPVPMKKLDHLGRIDKNGNVDDENPRLLTVVWGIDKEG